MAVAFIEALAAVLIPKELAATILNPAIFAANVYATTLGIGVAKVFFPRDLSGGPTVADANHNVIYHFNQNIKPEDVAKWLVNMHMEIIDDDWATFSHPNWSKPVKGYHELLREEDPRKDGLVHGGFSFHVPGLDQQAEGYYIAVNHTGKTQESKDGFNKTMHKMREHNGFLLSEQVHPIAYPEA